MDYIRARPEGECVYDPYTPKRRGITNIYAGELLYNYSYVRIGKWRRRRGTVALL